LPSIALAAGPFVTDEVALACPARAQLTVSAAAGWSVPDAAGDLLKDGAEAASGSTSTTGPAISASPRTSGRR